MATHSRKELTTLFFPEEWRVWTQHLMSQLLFNQHCTYVLTETLPFETPTDLKVKVKVTQSCLTLCDPMDYTVHGILQDRMLKWVAFPFSRGSSQPRDQTQISCIAGKFFTSWATREAQEYWSGEPIPSPADFPNPGIEPGSTALQVDSLPTELWGKPPALSAPSTAGSH